MNRRVCSASLLMLETLIILVYLNPVADLFPSFLQIGIFVLWALFSIRNTKLWGEALSISIINFIILVFSLLRCVMADQLNTDYYSTLQVVIARYQVFIYPILFIYVKGLSNRDKKKIFTLAIACILGTVLVSLYYIAAVDPQAIRNTQRSVALFGVGDFMLMYAIAIAIGPLLFLIIERRHDKKSNKLLIISVVLMVVCLILCNLVTSVVVAAISIFAMYIVRNKKKYGLVIVAAFAAIALAARTLLSKALFALAGKDLFYWSTNNKIIAIANVLSGDMTNIDTLSRRFMLARWSLESFKKHPFFGLDWKDHAYGTIGCHMQWADDLGRYGLIGNAIILLSYIRIAKYSVTSIENSFVKDSMITLWIMFFILGFLNPCLSATNLMMMFVVIPACEGMLMDA